MDNKIKSRIIIPTLYPPLKNKPLKLILEKDKEKTLGKISLNIMHNMNINMYKMIYLNDNENSLIQRSGILKHLVESNEELFNIELKRDKFKRPAPRKKSFKPENIEEKLKRIETKEKIRNDKPISEEIHRKTSLNIDNRKRKESIDYLFDSNMKKVDKNDGGVGEDEIINEDENSIINQEDEFSNDEEDYGKESYDDNDDDQCGKNYSEGGEY